MLKTNRQVSQELFEEMDKKFWMEEAIIFTRLKNKSKALYCFHKAGLNKDKDKDKFQIN